MTYTPYGWKDGAAGGTPMTAANLKASLQSVADYVDEQVAGTEGAPITTLYLEDFGGKADNGVTDNLAAWNAAVDTLMGQSLGGVWMGVGRVALGPGVYAMSDTARIGIPVLVEGQGGGPYYPTTVLYFPDGCQGVVIDVFPESIVDHDPNVTAGASTKLRDFAVRAAGRSNPMAHGIVVRQTAVLEGMQVSGFGGDGINLDSNYSLGSNATDWTMRDLMVAHCLNGVYVAGGNAGAGVATNILAIDIDLWGFVDTCSQASNLYLACNPDVGQNELGVTGDIRSGGGTSDGYLTRSVICKDIAIDDDVVAITDYVAGLLPSAGLIMVDNEWIAYTGITRAVGSTPAFPNHWAGWDPGPNFDYANLTGCTRGQLGTDAAAHLLQPFGDRTLTYFYWPMGVDMYFTGGGVRVAQYYESNRSLFNRCGSVNVCPSGNNAPSPWITRARLSETLLAADNHAHVQSTLGLPTSGMFRNSAEIVTYSGVTPGTPGILTGLTRGVQGSTPPASRAAYEDLQWPSGKQAAIITEAATRVEQRFSFTANGTDYWTPSQDVFIMGSGGVAGTGAGEATVSLAVDGSSVTWPSQPLVRAGHELSVTVSGLTGGNRVSFSIKAQPVGDINSSTAGQ